MQLLFLDRSPEEKTSPIVSVHSHRRMHLTGLYAGDQRMIVDFRQCLFSVKSGRAPQTSESLSKARDDGCELDRFDRLGHVHLVARRQYFQTILSTGVCGQRDCRNLPSFV